MICCFLREEKRILLLCVFLTILQGTLFIGIQVWLAGNLSFPLDDAFIHLQYGKQIALGHYYSYQDNALASTGETSFLYAHLLAFGYLIGLRGMAHLFWALIIAWGSVATSFYLIYKIGKRFSDFVAWGSLSLMFCSGYLAWGFWSGMEIALFTALFLLTFYTLLEKHFLTFFIALGFLSLCRPEGGIISVCLVSLLLLQAIYSKKTDSANVEDSPSGFAPLEKRQRLGIFFFCLAILFWCLCLILPYTVNWFLSGKLSGNSLLAKSVLYNPIFTSRDKIEVIFKNLYEIFLFLMGSKTVASRPGEFILPFTLFFSLAGLAGLWWSGCSENKWRACFFGFPLLAVLFSIASLEVWSLHSFRYIISYIPILYLLALLGLGFLCKKLQEKERILSKTIVSVSLLLLLSFYPVWAARYASQSITIREKQIRTAEWIDRAFPADTQIAINDAGALAYFGHHPLLDLVGLVSGNTTLPYRMGEGGLYEMLKNLPEKERPGIAAVFPSWFPEFSKKYDIFVDPLVTFHDPFDPGFAKTIYRINWGYAGMESAPRKSMLQSGWKMKDSLDIGDLQSEKIHHYSLQNRDEHFPKIPVPFRRNFGYHSEIEQLWPGIKNEQKDLIPILKEKGILNQYDIVDAGRRITGEETFTFSNLEPGKEAHLILRFCDSKGDQKHFLYRMQVFGNGLYLGKWEFGTTPWNWMESAFLIPEQVINKSTLTIKIKNLGSPDFSYYDTYYYWIYQD